MTQTKANYLVKWLREEALRTQNTEKYLRRFQGIRNEDMDDVWNFIAVNLPEAEQAFNSVMDLENYYMEGAPWK